MGGLCAGDRRGLAGWDVRRRLFGVKPDGRLLPLPPELRNGLNLGRQSAGLEHMMPFAVIVCDMWEAHHCVSAARRVAELALRMNTVLGAMRGRGAQDHPCAGRLRVVLRWFSSSPPRYRGTVRAGARAVPVEYLELGA